MLGARQRLHALKVRLVRWLLRDVSIESGRFGENSIFVGVSGVGDLIRWTGDQAPAAVRDVGMDSSGRLRLLVDLDDKGVALHHQVRLRARVASTSNVTLAAGAPDTVDGVSLAVNDLVLVTGQTAAAENGLYLVQTLGTGANGTWVRDEDANHASDMVPGLEAYIEEGDSNGLTVYRLVTTGAITLGTTALEWVQGGYFVRSDAAAQDVYASNASPAAIDTGTTAQTSQIDVRDFDALSLGVHITAVNSGSPQQVDVVVEWFDGAAVAASAQQGSESISGGAASISRYTAQFDVSAEVAPFSLPQIVLPVAGPNVRITISTDTGEYNGYARLWRKA